MSDDLKTGRTTPPKDDEWKHIWPALDKSDKAWTIVGPIWAVVSNWKALLAIAGVVAWINSGEIKDIILLVVGAAS